MMGWDGMEWKIEAMGIVNQVGFTHLESAIPTDRVGYLKSCATPPIALQNELMTISFPVRQVSSL